MVPWFLTRGVVLTPADLTLADWPERAAAAGLTTIAWHPTPAVVQAFVDSDAGQAVLDRCAALGLAVEYELHAAAELLPRELFGRDPSLFRMNDDGQRTPDANLCVHSATALTICAERAAALARSLRPTAGRWFLWGDDGGGWCRCPHCRGLSDSDQALLWEHSVLAGLRSVDPELTLAHLAYHNTLAAPTQVRPEPGIFLEYAPIHRTYDQPYAHQTGDAADALEHLDANLAVFDAATAQVLEYWLDESRFSSWRRPAVALPWRPDVMAADLATYAARGIRHATSFAVWLDEAYRQAHGEPPVAEYGQLLAGSVTA